MTNVAIIYYSMYGHVAKMVSSLKAGVTSVSSVKDSVYQVQETLNEDLLKALHAPPKLDLPIATLDVLQDADGILLGFPTRFGMLPAQVKGLFDVCGGLCARGECIGKPCGVFFSSSRVDLRSYHHERRLRRGVNIAESRAVLTPRRRRRL